MRYMGADTRDADTWKLIHWSWVTHICVGNLTIIGSDNGLSPDQNLVIIWTNDGTLLIRPLGTNFGEILIEIHNILLKKIGWKMMSENCWPFRLGLNVLIPGPPFTNMV